MNNKSKIDYYEVADKLSPISKYTTEVEIKNESVIIHIFPDHPSAVSYIVKSIKFTIDKKNRITYIINGDNLETDVKKRFSLIIDNKIEEYKKHEFNL